MTSLLENILPIFTLQAMYKFRFC